MATQRSFIPKGFQHLEFIHANKFIAKPQPRVPGSAPKQFVQLKDRIRHWNIVPGDKVRLTVGKPTDKYINQQSSKDGWKVHVVKSVDMERNRVYLEGVSNTKSGVFEPPPPEYYSWDADKKALWDKEHTAQKFNRPVHYSNLQLCLNDEAGPSSVFAVRIATSAPKYSTRLGRITWTRYAAKLSAPTRIPLDPERNLVPIPWPSAPERKPVDALEADTIEETLLNTRTLSLAPIEKYNELEISDLVSSHSEEKPPALDKQKQNWSTDYIQVPEQRQSWLMDMSMPLYLAQELSPRFSRAKQMKGWNERRLMQVEAREKAGQDAVDAWEARGRDNELGSMLESDVELEELKGVKLRRRTRAEVREAALAEFDAEAEARKRQATEAFRMGKIWDESQGGWVEGEQGKRREKKRRRKEKKELRMLEKLENLKLKEGKNMAVPPDMRI